MRTFSYRIRDALGIHARPAGLLAKTAKLYGSEITLEKDGKSVSCKGLLALMGLGVRCGDTVTVTITGTDEEQAERGIKRFLEENL